MPCAGVSGPVGHRRVPAGVLRRVIWGASCQEPEEEAAGLAIEMRPDRTERRRSRQCPKMPQINLPVHHPMDPGCDPQDGADCPRFRSRTDSFYVFLFVYFRAMEKGPEIFFGMNESIPRVIRCNQFNLI